MPQSVQVHVDTAIEQCREWNTTRRQQQGQQQQQQGASAEGTTASGAGADGSYSDEVFADLVGRFERPESRNRWDSPLFTVRPGASCMWASGSGSM